MRGIDYQQSDMFSYLSPEQRVRKDRPLRAVTDEILDRMSPRFDAMYAEGGRPSIPPEKLLRVQLLQMLYSVRSERQVVERVRAAGLISDEHFTVDGTLLDAWASLKSFQPKNKQDAPPPYDPGNPRVDFHSEKRSIEAHESNTDLDALLARKGKGKESKLSYNGNRLVENHNGLIVNAELLQANGRAERDAALLMLEQIPSDGRITVGGDKGFSTTEFVHECRPMNVTPHVAQNTARPSGSAIDARSTRHVGYDVSQKRRKRIEECFGWLKIIALLRQLKHRGLFEVAWIFIFAAAAYNLWRMRKLFPIPAADWSGPCASAGPANRLQGSETTSFEPSNHQKPTIKRKSTINCLQCRFSAACQIRASGALLTALGRVRAD